MCSKPWKSQATLSMAKEGASGHTAPSQPGPAAGTHHQGLLIQGVLLRGLLIQGFFFCLHWTERGAGCWLLMETCTG